VYLNPAKVYAMLICIMDEGYHLELAVNHHLGVCPMNRI
jgi:hypothetical protein